MMSRAHQRDAQEKPVPLLPSLRGARPQPPRQDDPHHGQHTDPPVGLHGHAGGEENLCRHGNGLPEVLEDLGEARDDEGHQEHDGRGPNRRDDGRVDHGGDDRLRERLPRLLKLGQPAQGGLQHAASFASTDHVDVQARKGAGMVLGEGIAERRAAPHTVEKVGDDRLHPLVRGQLLQDGERAIERHAGFDQGGQLLGHRQ